MGWTKEHYEENISAVREKYAIDPLEIYSKGYYARRIKMRDWEMRCGKALSIMLNLESIIDFGCGLGSYLEGAIKGKTKKIFGVDIGYEISKEFIPEYMHRFIVKGHVGRKLDYGKWDCALSIEVAEHLLPEEEDVFVTNIINASSRLIVLTAAFSYSYLHLNAGKMKEYWAKKFTDLGCVELFDEEEKLRMAWWGLAKSHIIKKVIVLSVG